MYLAAPEFQSKPQPVIETLLLSPKQTAQALQISERTVHKFIANASLPSLKFGAIRRVELSAIKAFIASGRKETRGRKPKAK